MAGRDEPRESTSVQQREQARQGEGEGEQQRMRARAAVCTQQQASVQQRVHMQCRVCTQDTGRDNAQWRTRVCGTQRQKEGDRHRQMRQSENLPI